jgi:hypothetical protein
MGSLKQHNQQMASLDHIETYPCSAPTFQKQYQQQSPEAAAVVAADVIAPA